MNLLDKKKKYWIAVLKNENREACKEVDSLLAQTKTIKMKVGNRAVMPPIYSSKIVHRFGHGRWNEEERGFNDLATNCH